MSAPRGPAVTLADLLRPNFIVLPLIMLCLAQVSAEQKTLSEKLAKGYTGVKKPFTLVRSRFSKTIPGGNRSSRNRLVAEEPAPGDDSPHRPGGGRNLQATMTKGDHMAAQHIPRTLRPAATPAAGVAHGTEQSA